MNRPALLLTVFASPLIGMLPYAAFLRSERFAFLFLLGVAIVAVYFAVVHKSSGSESPSPAEYWQAFLGSTAFTASASFLGLLFYAITYWGTKAIVLLSNWADWGIQWNPRAPAMWVSGVITLSFGLFAFAVSPVPRTLFPAVPGVVSAYAPLMRLGFPWVSIALLAGGVVVTVGSFFLGPSFWPGQIFALVLFVSAGQKQMNLANNWSPTAALGRDAVQAVQKLYDVLGYTTVAEPRTKDPAEPVNSLLQRVDLFASRGESDALAIQLNVAARENRPISAVDAAFLPVAARDIASYLASVGSTVHVKPVLVLVGRESTPELDRLADDEHMQVLMLDEDILREALRTEDHESLLALAQKALQVRADVLAPGGPPPGSKSAA